MYEWLVFVHVVGALGFFMVHGATASVMFRLKRERDPEKIRALLGLRDLADRWMALPILTLLGSGLILGFMGRWWNRGWIWVSLGILVATGLIMSALGRMYHMRIWEAIDPQGHPLQKNPGNRPPATPEQLEQVLASGQPWALTLLGVGALAIILWLMMFKPL